MRFEANSTTARTIVLSVLLVLASACLGATATGAAAHARTASRSQSGPKVVRRALAFDVTNVNRSTLPCASDGAPYQVKGHLVGPGSKIGSGAAGGSLSVTLYLHAFSSGEWFWNFTAVPRYDYAAAMARAGHVSVVVDRLGYGESGHPDGERTCLGAQADVAHQLIGKLRSGDYTVQGGEAPRFEKIALAGHAPGALIANLEAFSFNDIDALVGMGYSPQVSMRAFEQFYTSQEVCDAGGEPAKPGGAGGYAYFGQTEADFRANVFHNANPAVRDAATGLRTRDPCGDSGSLVDALVRDLMSLSQVKVPVLLVCGREDALTPAYVCPNLKRRYVGSGDVSLFFVSKAGSALPLERTAPSFRRRVSGWLDAHGF
jgi:pimeloyl-ACP methyl ester carboxylesterase